MALIASVYAGNYTVYSGNPRAPRTVPQGFPFIPGTIPPGLSFPYRIPSNTDLGTIPQTSQGPLPLVKRRSPCEFQNPDLSRRTGSFIERKILSVQEHVITAPPRSPETRFTKFTIDEILSHKTSSHKEITNVDKNEGNDSLDRDFIDVEETDDIELSEKGDQEELNDSTDTASRFSWLQCTRYKPPKLPRIKKKDGVKKRKLGRNPRVPFTQHQVSTLEQKFRHTHYLSSVDVAELSAALNLTETRVKIWFQNRRARERRDRDHGQLSTTKNGDGTSNNKPSNSLQSPTTISPGSTRDALTWGMPVPPNPSVIAHFSHALQRGTSAFSPVNFANY